MEFGESMKEKQSQLSPFHSFLSPFFIPSHPCQSCKKNKLTKLTRCWVHFEKSETDTYNQPTNLLPREDVIDA